MRLMNLFFGGEILTQLGLQVLFSTPPGCRNVEAGFWRGWTRCRLAEAKEERKSFSIILILNSEAFIVSIRNAK